MKIIYEQREMRVSLRARPCCEAATSAARRDLGREVGGENLRSSSFRAQGYAIFHRKGSVILLEAFGEVGFVREAGESADLAYRKALVGEQGARRAASGAVHVGHE